MGEELISTRRFQNALMEEERWKRIDSEFADDQRKQERLMERGAPRNVSSVPYDPLTLQYRETKEGELLRYSDNQIRYRAALRAEHLRKLQTKEGFNPITGEASRTVSLPPEPR